MHERRFRSVQGVALALNAAGRLPAGAAEWRVPEGAQTARDRRQKRLVEADVVMPGDVVDARRRIRVLAPELHSIEMPDEVRWSGLVYGAIVGELSSPGAPSQFGTFISGGRWGGGSAAEVRLDMAALRERAWAVLAACPRLEAVRRPRRARGEMVSAGRCHSAAMPAGEVRPRRPIEARSLVDAVCVEGWSISEVLRSFGWYESGSSRQKAVRHLVEVLQAVTDEWNGDEGWLVGRKKGVAR